MHTRRSKLALFVLLVLPAIVLAGCGGGADGSTTGANRPPGFAQQEPSAFAAVAIEAAQLSADVEDEIHVYGDPTDSPAFNLRHFAELAARSLRRLQAAGDAGVDKALEERFRRELAHYGADLAAAVHAAEAEDRNAETVALAATYSDGAQMQAHAEELAELTGASSVEAH